MWKAVRFSWWFTSLTHRFPQMDGFDMMKQLRQLPAAREVPAIALSGYASEKDIRKSLSVGFNAHISKPVDPAELLDVINKLLAKSRKGS